jgi:hypothetical protein
MFIRDNYGRSYDPSNTCHRCRSILVTGPQNSMTEGAPTHVTEPLNRRSAHSRHSRRSIPGHVASIEKKRRGGAHLCLWFGCQPTLRERGEAIKGEEGARCNTRSTFETSGCNTCNVHLKADETFETCI